MRSAYIADVVFSTLSFVAALTFGNAVVAGFTPELRDSAPWILRAAVFPLTIPTTLVEFLFPHEVAGAATLLALFVVVELVLIGLSPLVPGSMAISAARENGLTVDEAHRRLRAGPSRPIWAARLSLAGRVLRTMAWKVPLYAVAGAAAAGLAWCAITMVNRFTGGVVAWITTGLIVFVITFAFEAFDEISGELSNPEEIFETWDQMSDALKEPRRPGS